jgi:hypothetical protein
MLLATQPIKIMFKIMTEVVFLKKLFGNILK